MFFRPFLKPGRERDPKGRVSLHNPDPPSDGRTTSNRETSTSFSQAPTIENKVLIYNLETIFSTPNTGLVQARYSDAFQKGTI